MPFTTITGRHVPIQLWATIEEVESQALTQLKNIAALPWVAHHVAVMPDVHLGKGPTVGSVVAMREAVAPAAVGVDIGCGMAAVETTLAAGDLPDNLGLLRGEIERAIPVGMSSHEAPAWAAAPAETKAAAKGLLGGFGALEGGVQQLGERASCQLGTLGGGNHFIELCLDASGTVWLMLHSGSRHIGNALAEHHMQIARKLRHN